MCPVCIFTFFHVVEKSLDRKGIDLDMTGSRKAIYFIILCLVWPLMLPLEVQASPPDRSDGYTLPPHLIQSVTEQDLYEGMICLGMLECPVLQEADCEKAFENVKDCVVRVIMGNAYGSGILWELTADRVLTGILAAGGQLPAFSAGIFCGSKGTWPVVAI